jgi:hypothetical protein
MNCRSVSAVSQIKRHNQVSGAFGVSFRAARRKDFPRLEKGEPKMDTSVVVRVVAGVLAVVVLAVIVYRRKQKIA